MTRKIILTHERAVGDIVSMTALIRDIALVYKDQFQIDVHTHFKDVWKANPYLTSLRKEKGVEQYRLSYGESIGIAGKKPVHFLTAWHHDFKKKSGVDVPLQLPKPDIHLTPEERSDRIVDGRYWLVLAGGKLDFTTKHWSYTRHQQVVDALRKFGIPVVQAGARDKGPPAHYHPDLEGVLNLVGKTNVRELIRLIYQADGVICTITAAMHIAAAFDKPCVVTAGGREEWWWEGYTNATDNFGPVASGKVKVEHRYLHTQGLLDCCLKKGCWMNKVSPSESDDNRSFCKKPVLAEKGQMLPLCMDMITVDHVLEAVLSYYASGILPSLR